MPRPNKPFLKRGVWYTKIDGKYVNLGKNKRVATSRFHQLMTGRASDTPSASQAGESLTVAELVDLYLDDIKDDIKPVTWKRYRQHLQWFIDHSGDIRAVDLRPLHVANYQKTKTTWGANMRSTSMTIIKIYSRWTRRSGYLAIDPLADMKNRGITRRKPPNPGDLEKFQSAILAPAMKEWLEFALITGCRPGELRTLRSEDVDLEKGTAIVRGKSGERIITLSDRAKEMLAVMIARNPTGEALRNSKGDPWTESALHNQFTRAKKRAGLDVFVAYHTRGIFATNAVKADVNPLLISALLGHKDTTIVMKYYASPDNEMMRDAANQAVGSKDD